MVEKSTTLLSRRAPVSRAAFECPGHILHLESDLGLAKIQIFGTGHQDRFREVTGSPVPPPGCQSVSGPLAIAWLAPGEWLAAGPEAQLVAWLDRIEQRADDDVLAVEITHARASFTLSGRGSRTTLAAHCPLDLRPDRFPVGAAARSLLGDAGLFISRFVDVASGPRFRIVVDQTMANYVVRLLEPGASQ